MEKKTKTLEERVAALEAGGPKFKSFFDNNLDPAGPTKAFQQKLDLLEKRVKVLEDKLKKKGL